MAVSKIGLGWPVGERNYDTIALWNTAKGASGEFEQGILRGSVTAGNTTINGAFSAGAELIGFVEYDGSNHLDIATTGGNHTVSITSANVILRDLKIDYTNNFVNSVSVSGNNSFLERCYIRQGGTGTVTAITLNNTATNKGVRNCVIFGNGQALFTTGFNRDAVIDGTTGFGYAGAVISGSSNFAAVTNNFFLQNTGSTFAAPSSYGTLTNNATADATGNFTGYTSADLVDFANGDYRIKSSSDLAGLGIGAFFDAGGGSTEQDITIIAATQPTSAAAVLLSTGQTLNLVPAQHLVISTPVNIAQTQGVLVQTANQVAQSTAIAVQAEQQLATPRRLSFTTPITRKVWLLPVPA